MTVPALVVATCLAVGVSICIHGPMGVAVRIGSMFLALLRQRNSARRNGDKTLDYDSRKWDSLSCYTTEKGFREIVSGAFFFAYCSPLCAPRSEQLKNVAERLYQRPPHGVF